MPTRLLTYRVIYNPASFRATKWEIWRYRGEEALDHEGDYETEEIARAAAQTMAQQSYEHAQLVQQRREVATYSIHTGKEIK